MTYSHKYQGKSNSTIQKARKTDGIGLWPLRKPSLIYIKGVKVKADTSVHYPDNQRFNRIVECVRQYPMQLNEPTIMRLAHCSASVAKRYFRALISQKVIRKDEYGHFEVTHKQF